MTMHSETVCIIMIGYQLVDICKKYLRHFWLGILGRFIYLKAQFFSRSARDQIMLKTAAVHAVCCGLYCTFIRI